MEIVGTFRAWNVSVDDVLVSAVRAAVVRECQMGGIVEAVIVIVGGCGDDDDDDDDDNGDPLV